MALNAVRRLHRWLGLSVGVVLTVMGASGSLLVFHPAIDTWTHPSIRAIPNSAKPASHEAVYQALLARHPDRSARWRIELPSTGGAISARSLSADDVAGRSFAPLIAWVDPRTSTVVRSERWGTYMTTWIYDLHYRLGLGPSGAKVVGAIGLLAVGLILSGVATWLRRRRRGETRTANRSGRTRIRRVYDVHTTVGPLAAAFLLTSAATGALISFGSDTAWAVGLFSRLNAIVAPQSTPAASARLALDDVMGIALARFPDAAVVWIETPAAPTDAYHLTLRQPFEPSPRFPHTEVWVDQFSGAVLAVHDPRLDGPGDTLLNWLHSVHNAEAFGVVAQAWLVAVGTTPVVLLVTGGWWWWARRRAACGAQASRRVRRPPARLPDRA